MFRALAAVFLFLAGLSLGCAGTDPHSYNVPQATVDADYHACESRAMVSTAFIRSAGDAADKQQEIIDACMQEKGYTIK